MQQFGSFIFSVRNSGVSLRLHFDQGCFCGVSVDVEGSSFLYLSGETGGAYVHEKTCGGGSAVAERVRKKDNNIIIPTYLIISPNASILGERRICYNT